MRHKQSRRRSTYQLQSARSAHGPEPCRAGSGQRCSGAAIPLRQAGRWRKQPRMRRGHRARASPARSSSARERARQAPGRGPQPKRPNESRAVRPNREEPCTAPPGWDERLGSRWAVWVGGLALALGGLFLVRYSIEQGLLGPGARVAFGAAFAIALLAAGEWLRRCNAAPILPGMAQAHVPSVLTATGTSTAFATAYAAYALYGLIGPALAFVLLGAVSVLTMLAAALHGPALAALGLVAALASPLLVQTGKPNFWALVGYLAF